MKIKTLILGILLITLILIVPVNIKADSTASFPALTCQYKDGTILTQDNYGQMKSSNGGTVASEYQRQNKCPKEYNGSSLTSGTTASGDFTGNLTCGNANKDKLTFSAGIPKLTSAIYRLLQIATLVIMIISGMVDMISAITSQKEDNIKKAQQRLLKRIAAASIVFLIFVIVEVAIGVVAESDTANISDCLKCFLNGVCNGVKV